MELNEAQYERIAAFLDGRAIELTAGEREVAEEIRRGQAEIGDLLPAQAPREAMVRAGRRMRAALARPGRRWAVGIGLGVAAAAAIVLAAVALWEPSPPEVSRPVAGAPNGWVDDWVAGLSDSREDELGQLAREIDGLTEELAVGSVPSQENPGADLDVLELEIDEFWMDDPLPDVLAG